MSDDPQPEQPIRDVNDWPIERLEAFTAAYQGPELELIRVIAQSHTYRADEPRGVRLRWAKLSLTANERLPGDDPWGHARKLQQGFMLRTWVIEHLGPDTDPDWNPETLAADTLKALTLDPSQAHTLSAGWRDLPIEQMGELRRNKNLTSHVDRLVRLMQPGPAKDQLTAWTQVRDYLP